jgi:hypothetical protein
MSSHECAICLENIEQKDMYITDCCHKFCNECFVNWAKSCKEQKSDLKCPTCRTVLQEFIKPKEERLLLIIQNTINFDINYMYDQQNEDYDSEDENTQSDYEVDEENEEMSFYNVRVIRQEVEEDDNDDDECYHINRTRELEEELYGESFTY